MKTTGVVFAAICLTLMNLFVCDGRILRWIPNTDFENPRNWRTGRLPCNNEHVRFPPTIVSVFVQRNNTMLEIVLPNDGEIVLGKDVILTFPLAPDNDEACTEQDTFYNGSQPALWYDIRNWCEADDNDVCKENPPRRLHTEGIPCVFDDVVFLFDSRFVVDIDSGADIRINTVRIGQQQLTTSELRERINSDVAQRQFLHSSTGGDTTITVSGNNRCDDVTGCACSNQQLKDRVCAIETSRCDVSSCDDPVQPQQHCCAVCGAVLKLRYDSGFRLDAIERMLSDTYQSPTNNESSDEASDASEVWWIVSKVGSGSETVIQVVIADDGGGKSAKVVAYDIKQLLQNDMKETQQLRVTWVTMDVSGTARPSAHSHTGDEMNAASSPAVIVVIVIVIIIIIVAIACAVVCYVRRRQGKSIPRIPVPRIPIPSIQMPTMPNISLHVPQFMRWRPRAGRGSIGFGDMELGRRGVVFDNRIIFDVSASGFDNLTYENQPRRDLEQLEVQPGMAAESGFDNPMYGTGALQESYGIASAAMAVVPSGPRVSDDPTSPSTRTSSRLDSLPLVSKMAGMLRGLRFNVATQKLEETSGDVTGTGNDVNDNDKSYDSPQLLAEGDDDVPWTAAESKSAKRRAPWKTMKKSGREEERDGGQKHHKMDEEESTDSDEDLTGKTARKLAKQMGEKSFGNPCYDMGPVTTETTTPTSESTTRAATTDSYRTGFANPMFEEKERTEVTLQDGETEDKRA